MHAFILCMYAFVQLYGNLKLYIFFSVAKTTLQSQMSLIMTIFSSYTYDCNNDYNSLCLFMQIQVIFVSNIMFLLTFSVFTCTFDTFYLMMLLIEVILLHETVYTCVFWLQLYTLWSGSHLLILMRSLSIRRKKIQIISF